MPSRPPVVTPGPFARLPKAAIYDTRLTAQALRVLAAVASHGDANAICYPTIGRLAGNLGLSPRMVQRHLRALEATGYLLTRPQKRGHGNGPNLYQVQFPPSAASRSKALTRDDAPLVTRQDAPLASLRVVPKGVASGATQTRLQFKKVLSRPQPDPMPDVVRRMEGHGFSRETAWALVVDAGDQGLAGQLDLIMAAAEAAGTSAHDRILHALSRNARQV